MATQEGGKFEGLQGNSSDFLKVLLTLKANIMRDLHVATIGKVIEQYDTTFSVKPYPLTNDESEKVVKCYYLRDLELNVGDIVVVLYMDRDYIQAFKQTQLGQEPSKINKSSELHSEKYGIIIGILASGSQNNSGD